jgi:hypothetical protein
MILKEKEKPERKTRKKKMREKEEHEECEERRECFFCSSRDFFCLVEFGRPDLVPRDFGVLISCQAWCLLGMLLQRKRRSFMGLLSLDLSSSFGSVVCDQR